MRDAFSALMEGFYFKLRDGAIFYAKGVAHPPGYVVAFPKYVPYAPNLSALRGELRYNYVKLATLRDQLKVLRDRYPTYLHHDEYLCREVPLVPQGDVALVYDPVKKAEEVLSSRAVDPPLLEARGLLSLLAEATDLKALGLSGSMLVGLYGTASDIDVVVYGEREGKRLYCHLRELAEKGIVRGYSAAELMELYAERSAETPIPFNTFASIERKKVLEGVYRGRRYFVRLVKGPSGDEIYGSFRCRKVGVAMLKAKVVDDADSIFTPCRYRVEVLELIKGPNVPIDEIYALRGRFNEVASEGEAVLARGTVEELEYPGGRVRYRLYLGDQGDYVIPLTPPR